MLVETLGRPICLTSSEDAAAELASFVLERAALEEFPTWDVWQAARAAWSAPVLRGPVPPVEEDGVEQGFPSALLAGIRSRQWESCITLARSMEGVAAVLLGPHTPALALLCGATATSNYILADELLQLAQ